MSTSPPLLVYPINADGDEPQHRLKGSFGTVFVVLAVILVISAVACFLGRLCNRRFKQGGQKPQQQHLHTHPPLPSPLPSKHKDLEFVFRENPKSTARPQKKVDLEFGLDRRSNGGKLLSGKGGILPK